MRNRNWGKFFAERFAVAFVAAFMSAVTLLIIYPVAMLVLGGGAGGGSEFELAAMIYALTFSKFGLAVVVGSAVIGFCLGSDRMANVFSFFWGTHSFWSKLDAYLEEKRDQWDAEYQIPSWLLIIVLVLLIAVLLWLCC